MRQNKKQIVVLERKGYETEYFGTCVELVVKHGKDEIGVGLGALWNALCKNGGMYQNKQCKIYYKPVNQFNPITW